ncbi:MAG: pyridoxal phosphate-dependent aminotransferase [Bacteroidetes bacterium]|jgi:aspartate aminotransferase|nr:pyridoxal phosphate-dependent aminotransferase [Bacteroidota bacterium]
MPHTDVATQQKTVSISRRGREVQGSPIRKLASLAEARKKNGTRVYHLNIGQPDLPTPRAVFDAIQGLDLKTLAYAPSNGLPPALTAWKKYFAHHGMTYDERELIVTAGGSEAIVFAMEAVCDPGDEVIVFEPFYTNYNGFATIADVKLKPILLSIENGFHLPSEQEIEKMITPRTRAILFCNPSNPTGTVYTREELQRLASIASRHGLFILSDEVYREFAYEGEVTSITSFPEIRDRVIVLDSCSKRFNVCGARIGVLASHNDEVVSTVLKFGQARLSVATIEQLAVAPLLSDPEPYTAPIVEEFRRRRDAVYEGLAKIPGVTFYKPEGAFYIVIGLPVKDSEHFAKWLIEEYSFENETLLLAPAQGFYATPGKGMNEVRLAFMLNIDDLHKSLRILAAALETYQKKF